MRLPGKRRARAITLLAAAALAVVAGARLYQRAGEFSRGIAPLIVAELRASFGRDLTIGSLDYRVPGILRLRGVRLAGAKRRGARLEAREVIVRYRWRDLLFHPRRVVDAVDSVEVSGLRLRVARLADGRWNLAALVPPAGAAQTAPFRGTVLVRSGAIDVTDLARQSAPEVRLALRGVSMRIDARDYPCIRCGGTGTIAGAHGGAAGLEGYYRADNREWLARVAVAGLDAAYWSRFVGLGPSLSLVRGRADARLLVTSSPRGGAPLGQGTVQLTGATLRVAGLGQPLTGATIELAGMPDYVTYSGSGRVAGAPVRFRGDSLPRPAPRFRLTVHAEPAGLAPIRAAFPQANIPAELAAPGKVSLDLQLGGEGGTIDASGTVAVGLVRAGKIDLSDLRAEWRSAGKAVQIPHLAATAFGGRVEGEGWVATTGDGPEVFARGRITGVDLSHAPEAPEGLGGVAEGDFEVRGPLAAPTASGSLRVTNVTLRQVRLQHVEGSWSYADQVVTVRDARATDPRGAARLFGTIGRDGTADLRVSIRVPSLSDLAAELNAGDLSGRGYFQGHVYGPVRNPRVEGDLRLDAPRWRQVRLDEVESHLEWDGNELVATSARAIDLPGVATAREIRLSRAADGSPIIRGAAVVRDIHLASLIRLLGGGDWLRREPLAGRVRELAAEFEGPLSAPRVTLHARGDEFAARGIHLGSVSAEASVDVSTGEIVVGTARAIHGRQRLEARGRARFPVPPGAGSAPSAPPPAELTLDASDTEVLPLLRRFAPELFSYVDVDGEIARLHVEVTGTAADPRVEGDLRTSPLALNGEAFRPASLRFSWRPDLVTVSAAVLEADAGGRFSIPAAAWVPGAAGRRRALDFLGQVAGTADIQELPLAVARRLLRESPRAGDPAWAPVIEWLEQLRPTTTASLQATLTCPGPEPVSPAWTERSVATLAAYRREHPAALSLSVPDLAIVALSPREAGEPEVRPLHFKIDSRIACEPARVNLDELLIDQLGGDAQVRAKGWRDLSEGRQPGGDSLQLELDAYNIPLTAVARLPARRLQARLRPLLPLRGMAELHAIATGDAAAPNVQLSASVDNLVARGLPLGRLNAGEVEISAADGKIRILEADLVQHHLQHDHRLQVSGELPFSWALPGIPPEGRRDLKITLPEQPLEVLNDLLKATQEQGSAVPASLSELGIAGGTIAAEIELKGSSKAPENTGFLTVKQAAVELPGDTSLTSIEGTLRFAGDEVRVERLVGGSSRSGGFQVTGRSLLGGSEPQLDLQLQANQFRFAEEHLERFSPLLKGLGVRGTIQTVDRQLGRDPDALRITGPWNHPKISGAIRLARATSGVPPDATTRFVAKPAIDPELDIRLFVGNEVAIRNPLVDMRLDGSLRVTNTLSAPVITGRLTVPRGSMQMPTLRFRIEGSIRVAYDGRQTPAALAAAPIFIDLTGVSHLSVRESLAQPAEDVQVVMTVRGSPSSPATAGEAGDPLRESVSGQLLIGAAQGLSVEFHSDPPLPSQQLASVIRQQLGVEGITASDANLQSVLRQQVQLALANTVAPLFTSHLEDYLQRALSLDVLSIEVGGIEQPLQVRVGKRLIGGLYGTVLQQIGTAGESSQSWELYYRLTHGLRLGMRREEPSSRQLFFMGGSLQFK